MDISEIQANVDLLTNRPDMIGRRDLKIQETTIRLHSMDMWQRDMVERLLIFATSDPIQVVNLSGLPRFRLFRYVRKYDPSGINPLTGQNTGAAGDFFEDREPDGILNQDRYGDADDNLYYISGGAGGTQDAVAQFRSFAAFQYLLVAYQQNPIVSPIASYSSWLANLYPYAIITIAARSLLMSTGQTEAAKGLEAEANSWIATLGANVGDIAGR